MDYCGYAHPKKQNGRERVAVIEAALGDLRPEIQFPIDIEIIGVDVSFGNKGIDNEEESDEDR